MWYSSLVLGIYMFLGGGGEGGGEENPYMDQSHN